jgi:ABC-type nitrate/sulfonate/bicarbonate transport system substrate-binding protein
MSASQKFAHAEKIFKHSNAKSQIEKESMKRKFLLSVIVPLVFVIGALPWRVHAQQKLLEKVRLTVPAKSLTFVPYYFGKAKKFFEREGIDLEIVVMRPPIGITALQANEVDYSAAGGLSIRAAMKGLPLRNVMFIQTRLSFSLVGQPGMAAAKIRNVAVSGIGSLAHYAGITLMKRLGNEKVAYISTNTTPNSYTALLGKGVDAAILTPPHTSMAILAGYPDLGNTFDVRDLQGGLVARASHIQDHHEQVRSMIRGTLRSMDVLVRNEAETVPYLQKDFGLEPKIAADTYKTLRQIVNSDGDIEEPVLKSIIDKIRQESGIAAEIPMDRLVDLAILREVKTELKRK